VTQLSNANLQGMKTLILDSNLYINTDDIPWTPWVIPGMYFKMLSYEGEKCSLLVKMDKGITLAMHRHLEPVEFFLLEGSFGYVDDETGEEYLVRKMGYLFEPPGTVHRPITPDGCLGFSVLHGKIQGFDADGNSIELGTVEYLRRAEANNALGHLKQMAKIAA